MASQSTVSMEYVYEIINQIDDLKVDTFLTPAKSDVMRNAEYKLYVESHLISSVP